MPSPLAIRRIQIPNALQIGTQAFASGGFLNSPIVLTRAVAFKVRGMVQAACAFSGDFAATFNSAGCDTDTLILTGTNEFDSVTVNPFANLQTNKAGGFGTGAILNNGRLIFDGRLFTG